MKVSTGPIADVYASGSPALRARIADTRDVAATLGVSRQRVGQLAKGDRTFPRHFTEISGGRLWHRAGIQLWVAAHRPTSPFAGPQPFGFVAGQILLAAEAIADDVAPGYVGNLHVWLAIATSERDRRIHQTLATLGVDAAEFERAVRFSLRGLSRETRSCRMTPHVQELLWRAARTAMDGNRQADAIDIATAFIDGDERYHRRRYDGFLDYLERRGLEIAELRRRLGAVALGDSVFQGETRQLTKRRPARRRRRRLPGLDFARNPLGHDPWDLPWGAAFAVLKDGRGLVLGGEQWFFRTDGDGYYIRTRDGRPVGYRYRVDPPPRRGRGNPRPVNGFLEVLPMPPGDVAHWPDHRFVHDD